MWPEDFLENSMMRMNSLHWGKSIRSSLSTIAETFLLIPFSCLFFLPFSPGHALVRFSYSNLLSSSFLFSETKTQITKHSYRCSSSEMENERRGERNLRDMGREYRGRDGRGGRDGGVPVE